MSLLKKHWHKFIVASFASFWAGCGGDSESSTQPTYQDPASSANESVPGSSANEAASSGSQELQPGSSGAQVSSSNAGGSESTSSNSRVPFPTISSSSVEAIAEPMYGVMAVTCEPTLVEEYQSPACQDEICPDYGVEIVQTEGCDCTNGKKYTLKEFGKFFGVADPSLCDPFAPLSSASQGDGGTESTMTSASESPANSNSSEESTTTSASEDPATSSSSVGINESPFVEGTPFIDQPAVYGPPCYFDGSCATTPVVPTTEEKE